MKIDGILRYEQSVYVEQENLLLAYLMYTEQDGEQNGRTVYCLEILAHGADGMQSCRLYDVATSPAMAQRIWRLFTEELVTPVTAADIMEQLLSDADFLYADT